MEGFPDYLISIFPFIIVPAKNVHQLSNDDLGHRKADHRRPINPCWAIDGEFVVMSFSFLSFKLNVHD
jgi:hypothetical protein